MGQFKPMVKMMTTEPTVELKLKKGGSVKAQAGGLQAAGAAPRASAVGMPARGGSMPAAAPAKPSLMARRRAMRSMPAGAAPAAPVGRAAMMMKEGGESKAEHVSEMKEFSKIKGALKSHADKPASKAHKGLKTGGVVEGQGGYKTGGIIKSTKGETKVVTGKTDHSPASTGEVTLGNAGGYKTGGVAKANGGGYKKGGCAKKAYATGGSVNKAGAPVAMPQGNKSPSQPVSISRLSGTFKRGGSVKMNQGGDPGKVPAEAKSEMKTKEANKAYENWREEQRKEMEEDKDFIPSLARKAYRGLKGLFSSPAPAGSVTKTEKSVTVAPGKKRGGSVKC